MHGSLHLDLAIDPGEPRLRAYRSGPRYVPQSLHSPSQRRKWSKRTKFYSCRYARILLPLAYGRLQEQHRRTTTAVERCRCKSQLLPRAHQRLVFMTFRAEDTKGYECGSSVSKKTVTGVLHTTRARPTSALRRLRVSAGTCCLSLQVIDASTCSVREEGEKLGCSGGDGRTRRSRNRSRELSRRSPARLEFLKVTERQSRDLLSVRVFEGPISMRCRRSLLFLFC